MTAPTDVPDDVRQRAIVRLKKKRDFLRHVVVYVLVNSFLVVIWSVTGSGFFWPVFPIVAWGIGLLMNGWDVWRPSDFTEDQISREIARIRRPD
jgi:hypothetical protein